jgi:hypothetical protein
MKGTKLLAMPGCAAGRAAMATFAWCSIAPKGESTNLAAAQKAIPSGIMIENFNTMAAVTGMGDCLRLVTHISPEEYRPWCRLLS